MNIFIYAPPRSHPGFFTPEASPLSLNSNLSTQQGTHRQSSKADAFKPRGTAVAAPTWFIPQTINHEP